MGFLGMLQDSLRESLDRRSLLILIIISTLFILICFSIGYEQVRVEQAVQEMQGKFEQLVGGRWRNDSINARFEIHDIKTVGEEKDFEEFEGGTAFRVRAYTVTEFQRLVLFSRGMKGSVPFREWPKSIPGLSEDLKQVVTPPTPEDMTWFIGAKLREHNFLRPKVVFEGVEGDRVAFRVWLKKSAVLNLSGGFRLNVMFGAWNWDLRDTSVGDAVYYIQDKLASLIAGWIGILVAIVATAAFIPNMVQKGTVDLLLARPIPRWRVFLYKYFGGLLYVTITAGYLIVGSWLAIALRSGIWSPGFLMSWPLLVFFFAALYSVSALIGLLTRSPIASILISAVVWLFLSILGTAYIIIHLPMADIDPDHGLVKTIDVAHDVLPRLKDVDQAIVLCQLKANGMTPERYAHIYPGIQFPEVQWVPLFGVTGAWMVALLALGCWRFSKRDY